MSIASEISRLQTAKAALKTAIEGKGVTVPAAATLDGFAALVDQISQGGGGTIEAGISFDTFDANNKPTHANIYPLNADVWSYACASQGTIESVDLHGTVDKIGQNAFLACTKLALISLPSTVTEIGSYAFQNCTTLALTRLPDAITKIGSYAFKGCTQLALTQLPSALVDIGYSVFENTAVTFDTIPTGVTQLKDSVFYMCTGLTSITAAGLNITANQANFQGVFKGCTNLATVDLNHPGRFYTNYFSGCTALDTLIIRQTDAVATIYNTNAFLSTPIRSGTGKVYVPQALVNSYKSASNWSTYVSAGTQILPIEGSIYETHYANGEAIS